MTRRTDSCTLGSKSIPIPGVLIPTLVFAIELFGEGRVDDMEFVRPDLDYWAVRNCGSEDGLRVGKRGESRTNMILPYFWCIFANLNVYCLF
jgi:hypothetical protein